MSDPGSGRQWRPPGLQDRVETEAVAPGGGGQLGGRLQPPQGDPRGVRWHRQSEVLDCGYSHLLPVMWNPVMETFCVQFLQFAISVMNFS